MVTDAEVVTFAKSQGWTLYDFEAVRLVILALREGK